MLEGGGSSGVDAIVHKLVRQVTEEDMLGGFGGEKKAEEEAKNNQDAEAPVSTATPEAA